MFPTEVIYDDMNIGQLEALPDSAPHRIVDLAIVKADQEGESVVPQDEPYLMLSEFLGTLVTHRLREVLYYTPQHDLGHSFKSSRTSWHPEPLLSANTQVDPSLP